MNGNIVYSKFRWFMAVTVTIGYMAVGALLIAPSTIIGIIAKDFNITAGEASLFSMGTYTLAGAIGGILAGFAIDKFGVARVITIGSFFVLLAALLSPIACQSIPGLIVVRVAVGLFGAPIPVSCATIAARWFPESERTAFAGLQGAGVSIGVVVGLLGVPALMQATGGNWQAAFGWMGIGPFITLILCIVTLFKKEPIIDNGCTNVEASTGKKGNFAIALTQSPFYIGFLIIFIFLWIMNAFNDLTPGYIAIAPPVGLGFGPAVAGQSMMFVQLGMIIGSFAVGFITEMILKRNLKLGIIIGFALAAVFMFSVRFQFVFGNMVVLCICLFLAGFFEAFIIPNMAVFIAKNYPIDCAGRVYGISFGMANFGSTLGVSLGAMFLHFTGNYLTSIFVVFIVALVGFVFALLLKPPKAFAVKILL